MTDWQPIASAPTDGTTVLIYQPDGQWQSTRPGRREIISTASWHQPGNPAARGFWCAAVIYRPTHWLPLPAPPVAMTQEGGVA